MIKEVSENQVPIHLRAGRSRFSRYFAKTTLRIFGWQVSGNIPNEERIVVVAAPHTSNWDFIIGMLTILALNVNLKWIGKSSIFKPGFKWFFKWLGGIPVDRDNPSTLIDEVKDIVAREKGVIIGMAPEGSRQKVMRWKTGFLRISGLTRSKILFFAIDAPSKCILIGDIFIPSGKVEEDLEFVKSYFMNFKGINPEQS
jgi:1-acyl-sn-glycerol-3-phosphate acyltransferase